MIQQSVYHICRLSIASAPHIDVPHSVQEMLVELRQVSPSMDLRLLDMLNTLCQALDQVVHTGLTLTILMMSLILTLFHSDAADKDLMLVRPVDVASVDD